MELETCLLNAETVLLRRAAEYSFSLYQHRAGVKSLAFDLLQLRPEAFPLISEDPQMLEEYIELHDQSKLHPKYFWEMVRVFGVDIKTLPKSQRLDAQRVVCEINWKDQETIRMFFESHRLIDTEGRLKAKALELLKIEKIADVVERGSSRLTAREFGRKVTKGSDYLSDSTDVELALFLEANSCVLLGE